MNAQISLESASRRLKFPSYYWHNYLPVIDCVSNRTLSLLLRNSSSSESVRIFELLFLPRISQPSIFASAKFICVSVHF